MVAEADLRIGEAVALGDTDLAANDVDPGDLFGDGVLDLDAWVDLDEIEPAGVGVDEELDRPGILVAGRPADRQGSVADLLPHAGIEVRRGGHLHHLLVAALHRAVAFEEVHEPPVHVAEELDLDVAGVLDELLDEHLRAAEGRLALALGALERHGKLVFPADDPHPAASAAMRRLDHHRPAELLGDPQRLGLARHRLRAAGENRHPSTLGEVAGGGLVAERLEELHPRADERDPRRQAGRGKLGILREEAVARVDRVYAVRLGQRHDPIEVEVGADRLAGTADEVRLVGLEAVEGEPVLVGIDRHGADPQLVGRAEDADGDLGAVGDQQLLDRTGHVDSCVTGDGGATAGNGGQKPRLYVPRQVSGKGRPRFPERNSGGGSRERAPLPTLSLRR